LRTRKKTNEASEAESIHDLYIQDETA